eukprot:scaffold75980_cov56-Phaeocystis_antarctica.AAC.1
MARSTGSHCGWQAPPRMGGRDSPSESALARSTGRVSTRWSRNGTASSLRSIVVAAQATSGAPFSTYSQTKSR